MSITAVTRTHPQSLIAVPVSIDTVGPISALFMQLHDYGYSTASATGGDFPGGWRLIISQTSGAADQVVYFGDWIVVADAAYDPSTGWTVSSVTQVSCYGVSTELAGTAEDFANTFTVVTPKTKTGSKQ
jgi:hypothetical protein